VEKTKPPMVVEKAKPVPVVEDKGKASTKVEQVKPLSIKE
jgi:hypothetical protein